ncbi:recombinase family protein [Rhodobacter capsulatus]|uniref:recombinase family protein n=1 Tax=Rhodobacter capsulatus TaxID=1061 RepID=UPI00402653DC
MTQPQRVALYARFSTDKQRDASIEDQLDSCREHALRMGWQIAGEYSDKAVSGASMFRTGIKALLRDAKARKFDIVLSEALDRLSRKLADIAGFHDDLEFGKVELHTLTEGKIDKMLIGMKGTMNEIQLRDIALKTRRGQKGRIKAGKNAGGKSYGYKVLPPAEVLGKEERGDLEIDPMEAVVVRRIFEDYAIKGLSPKKIAETLNLEGVPAPRGKYWSASTLHGNRERGTGLLNNPLYAGVRVWNRLNYAKDPDTGKRVSRQNPAEIVEKIDVPHLRIVDEALWEAVRTRQGSLKSKGTNVPIYDRRRPKFLLSYLLKCGCCGSGFSKVGQDGFGCTSARTKGKAVCTNMTVIKKDDIEGRVLHALEHHLMDDEAVRVFCEEYAAERNRLEKAADTFRSTREAELRQVQRDHDKLVDALLEGVPAARVKSKMDALAVRQAELEALLAASPAPSVVRFHPSMAGTYRRRIRELIAALTEPAHASEAKDAIRGLIEKIVLHPVPSATAKGGVELVADLHGSLAGLLRLATGQPVHVVTRVAAGTGATEMQLLSNGAAVRSQVTDIMEELVLVAGAGFEPAAFRL